jgi:hypothetical protein
MKVLAVLTAFIGLAGLAAAIADRHVSEAAYSSSRSCYVSSMLSSYSSAIASSTATSVGAISTIILAPSIPHLPPGPSETAYPRDGKLHGAQPAPFTPSGGLGTNGSEPVYVPETDFDFQSIVSYARCGFHSTWLTSDVFLGTCAVSGVHRT